MVPPTSAAPPYRPQNQEEINTLMTYLSEIHNRPRSQAPFVVRSTTYPVSSTPHSVTAWKFQEQDFRKGHLPVHARGLFTVQNPETKDYRIAVRGYDKFFNIGEVPRTKWDAIESHTSGPYEVTLKENGCIIFISGLEDGTLLVTSKNSLGERPGEVSHAQVGEKWVDRQLAGSGRSRRDLALEMYKMNATAVAELCDDEFEEHILAYTKETAGLYLHGVNVNVPVFETYSMAQVGDFADRWGFQKIKWFQKDTVRELREFLEETEKTGAWEGRDVEGFVIRCKSVWAKGGATIGRHDWFFKYKFEEPYLLYRQWRETTKAMINGRAPKYNKHKEITKEYLAFAANYFKHHPGAATAYQANHGIIELRNRFLQSHGIKNTDIIAESKTVSNLVLVPIATIGCGKTTLATALTKLFDWAHIQNDDITTRKNKPQAYAAALSSALTEKAVVIADRNNAEKRERQQLINDISFPDNYDLVALHYVHEPEKTNKIRAATQKRVFARGDNHQTIQAGSDDKQKVKKIMEGFLRRLQPVDETSMPDLRFAHIINIDPIAPSRENLETVVRALHEHYPAIVPAVPEAAEMDAAIEYALDYKPTPKHRIERTLANNDKSNPASSPSPAAKPTSDPSKNISYFRVSLPSNLILSALEETFSSQPAEKRAFYEQLRNEKLLQSSFHVTLLHVSSKSARLELWEKYVDAWNKAGMGVMGTAEVRLKEVVWDERIMAATVELGEEWECANERPHVTLGMVRGVKPVESNTMLGKEEGVERVRVEGVVVGGQVEAEGHTRR